MKTSSFDIKVFSFFVLLQYIYVLKILEKCVSHAGSIHLSADSMCSIKLDHGCSQIDEKSQLLPDFFINTILAEFLWVLNIARSMAALVKPLI